MTDSSNVVIDNEHQDNEQLVNVYDLVIDTSATLKFGADAHILENYRGDKEKSGTLEIPAGKGLTADGAVTDLTRISIYDYDNVVPEKAQVYVISGAGSTTDDGDFTWIDTRNGVYMDWKAIEDNKSQWWLVNDPNPERHGGLQVKKTVSGSGASNTEAFTFTVTLDNTTISGVYGDMTFEKGIATFTLKADESKTASNLPAGVGYTVEEKQNAGYTVTVNGTAGAKTAGTIAANITATEAFNNHKDGEETPTPDPKPEPTPDTPDDVPQTGDTSNISLWIALACFSVFGIAVILFGRKQRHKRHK